jgi:hypothetical protein
MKWRPIDENEEKPVPSEMIWTELAQKASGQDGQTMINCRYISKPYYANGGWVNIDGDTYLENADTFEQLELQHVIGVPLAPFRHNFNKPGELKCFTLLFPKVPKYWKSFHLVERAGAGSFRVRDIHRNDSGIYIVQLT